MNITLKRIFTSIFLGFLLVGITADIFNVNYAEEGVVYFNQPTVELGYPFVFLGSEVSFNIFNLLLNLTIYSIIVFIFYPFLLKNKLIKILFYSIIFIFGILSWLKIFLSF